METEDLLLHSKVPVTRPWLHIRIYTAAYCSTTKFFSVLEGQKPSIWWCNIHKNLGNIDTAPCSVMDFVFLKIFINKISILTENCGTNAVQTHPDV